MSNIACYATEQGAVVTTYWGRVYPAVGRTTWTADEVRDLEWAITQAGLVRRETGLLGIDLAAELDRRWPLLPDERMYRLSVAARIVTEEVRCGYHG